MNIGFWSCIILVIPFLIIGVLFAIFKEKAAKFVSGFNSFSKEEQALYDKAHISRDIRNQCFMWAIIMLAGALLSCFLTPYIAIPTYIIWLVLFFREVHFDNHKAFEKYLLKQIQVLRIEKIGICKGDIQHEESLLSGFASFNNSVRIITLGSSLYFCNISNRKSKRNILIL